MPFQPGNALGRKWAKGESGNPKGRTKRDFALAEAARVPSAEMFEIILGIARDQSAPPETRLRAAEAVLSRGFGRPIAPHVIEGRVESLDATAIFVAALRAHGDRLRVAENVPALPAAQ